MEAASVVDLLDEARKILATGDQGAGAAATSISFSRNPRSCALGPQAGVPSDEP